MVYNARLLVRQAFFSLLFVLDILPGTLLGLSHSASTADYNFK